MAALLIAVIYLAFVSLGLPDSLLGSAWPALHIEMGIPLSYAGIVSMIISFSTICSSLLSERMTSKFGTRIVTSVSVLLTAVALFGFSVSSEFYMLCLWAVPYGLGAGAIDSALNNYVALHYSARHMSWLHCFWGLGAAISPYIMSYALGASSWQMGYRTVSVIQICISVVLFATLPVWKINAKKSGDASEKPKLLGIRGALATKGVLTLVFGFFGDCALESTVMLWSCSYLVRIRDFDESTAAGIVTVYFIGMTLGRFITGFFSGKLGDRNMVRLGTAVVVVGIITMWLPLESDIPCIAGLMITGLGIAPVYPAIIHSTPQNFGREKSQGIIGIQMASAYLGSTFMPPLFGIVANNIGISLFPPTLLLFAALMITMIELTFRITGKQRTSNNADIK